MKALLLLAWLCLVQGGVIGLVIAAVLKLPASAPAKVVIGAGLLIGFFIVWRLGIAVEHLRKIEVWGRAIFTATEMARTQPDGSIESATQRVMQEMKDERLEAKWSGQDGAMTAYRWCVAFIALVSLLLFGAAFK